MTVSERIRGRDGGQPHMDGSATITFDKYPDRPGQVSQNCSPGFQAWLHDIANEVEELERQTDRHFDRQTFEWNVLNMLNGDWSSKRELAAVITSLAFDGRPQEQ